MAVEEGDSRSYMLEGVKGEGGKKKEDSDDGLLLLYENSGRAMQPAFGLGCGHARFSPMVAVRREQCGGLRNCRTMSGGGCGSGCVRY